MRNSFKISFYIKKKQPLKCGYHPIMCRITINGSACAFSTHLTTKLSKWSSNRMRMSGRDEEAVRTNKLLREIYFSIYDIYMKLRGDATLLSPQLIRDAYLGKRDNTENLIGFFCQHNQEFKKMVGVTRSKSTLYKYIYVMNHLKKFIYAHYHVADVSINLVDINFVRDFHCWLINDAKCSTNTTWLYMVAFKHILQIAVSRGVITSNPFSGYRLHSKQCHRNFLSKNEIKRIVKLPIESATESLVRDAFIFCCFTGLSYSDVKNLKLTDIISDGNNMYIAAHRIKTLVSINIPLIKLPSDMVKQYGRDNPDAPLFPLPTNYWCNSIIARLIKRASITKHITFHSARHTFATTITLSEGVPIEVVSNMLGHTNIKTTQTYAKVLQCTANSEIQRASKSLNSYFNMPQSDNEQVTSM